MKHILLILFMMTGPLAFAQDDGGDDGDDQQQTLPAPDEPEELQPPQSFSVAMEQTPAPLYEGMSREPSADSPAPGRRANEDELRVRPSLPEAALRRDTRSMQSEVYKSIYNRELKHDQREDVLDE